MGQPDPDAMLDAMPDHLLDEWIAYDRVEGIPWPWLQTGIQTAAIVNCHSRKPRKPLDYMPVRKVTPRRPMDPRAIMAGFKAAAIATQNRKG